MFFRKMKRLADAPESPEAQPIVFNHAFYYSMQTNKNDFCLNKIVVLLTC